MSDVHIIQADARAIPLRDECVQCVVTSPPYWGLRKYAGAQGDEPYGLEPTIQRYLENTVDILREIRRVLRPDGVVFWNIGDSYAGGSSRGSGPKSGKETTNHGTDFMRGKPQIIPAGLKPKDLCLIPERVAIAAQADGWWVRSIIIWAKPNPMPESCTDRPTDAYEHIIMLTKSEHYFWDADAVREPAATDDMRRPYGSEGMWQMDGRPIEQRHGGKPRAHSRGNGNGGPKAQTRGSYEGWVNGTREILTTRNMRNVWTFPTQPYKGAHFATFPEEIPRRAILAATSERGTCVHCESPWRRVTERFDTGKRQKMTDGWDTGDGGHGTIHRDGREAGEAGMPVMGSRTTGWEPGCKCNPKFPWTPKPCLVLDPFGGSGTTARVAVELNRRAVSLDLAYHDHAEKRTRNVQRQLVAL